LRFFSQAIFFIFQNKQLSVTIQQVLYSVHK